MCDTKNAPRDGHSREEETCRKRPCLARECAKAHSLKQKETPYPLRMRGRGVEVSKTLFYILVRESCIKHSLQFQVLQGEIWGHTFSEEVMTEAARRVPISAAFARLHP